MRQLRKSRTKGVRTLRPHHRFKPSMRAMGTYTTEDAGDLVLRVLERMRSNRMKTGAGSYLFGDGAGRVYVVAEGSSTAQTAITTHQAWWVGTYASGDGYSFPAAGRIMEDLAEHFASLVRG